jgi:hypothetical protein
VTRNGAPRIEVSGKQCRAATRAHIYDDCQKEFRRKRTTLYGLLKAGTDPGKWKLPPIYWALMCELVVWFIL